MLANLSKQLFFWSLSCLLIGSLCSCSSGDSDEAKPKTLTLVTSADYPPFEFMRSGKIVGLDVDIARAITKELGVELEIQDMNFSSILSSLQTGRADFAMAGLTVTKDRQENVDFSDIYFQPSLAVLTKTQSPIKSVANLAGKRLGAQIGSTMDQFVKDQAAQMQGVQLTLLARNPDLVQELKAGRIDAVVIEAAQATAFAKVDPGLTVTIFAKAVPGYAIAFPKNSPWVDKFNEALARLRNNGEIQAIETSWLTADID